MSPRSRNTKKPRAATAIDEAIGRELTKRRAMLGLSQTELAKALGITHRQVQKYENGINRLSVSRLVQIAEVLNTPVGWFFSSLEQERRAQVRPLGHALLGLLSASPRAGAQKKIAALLEWIAVGDPEGSNEGLRVRQTSRRHRA